MFKLNHMAAFHMPKNVNSSRFCFLVFCQELIDVILAPFSLNHSAKKHYAKNVYSCSLWLSSFTFESNVLHKKCLPPAKFCFALSIPHAHASLLTRVLKISVQWCLHS
ncbi:unnamed protein product [Cuscuta epithymum]|uniref:Uncharacterized protein n=1 Tax=Cuscuta epithymum TaxID=186058 RepID=A0AAV0DKF1_9ASTE|nr:unnamed protein product [Cuscuta epithymum]CAH9140721.1 unnamed protein product [Cuscuta epithymum]